MNKIWTSLTGLTLCCCLASCGNKEKPEEGSQAAVNFVMEELYEQEAGCDTSAGECTEILFSYPRIVSSGNQALNDTLSAQIRKWLTGSIDSANSALSPEEFTKSFISDYEKFKQEFPESSAKWYIHRNVEVIANNESFTTLQLSEDSYLGGAHGMNIHLFANFEPSGKRISLDELIAEGQQDSLEAVAESLFREENTIPAGQSLKEAGYFYLAEAAGDNPFQLTENFAITRDGLLFYYNPYDIAPYAMGATVLKVPFSKIGGMLRKDGVLKELL